MSQQRLHMCVCRLGQGPSHEGNKKQKADWGRERFIRKDGREGRRRAIKDSS